MKVKKIIAALMTVVMLMCSVQVTAGAETNIDKNNEVVEWDARRQAMKDLYTVDFYGLVFGSVEKLEEFMSQPEVYGELGYRDLLFKWVTTSDSLFVPKALKNDTGSIKEVRVTTLVGYDISVTFEKGGTVYELWYDLSDYTKQWYDHLAESYNDAKLREDFDIQRHTHNGTDVWFERVGEGAYYFMQDGKCFKLKLRDRKTFSEEDLEFCEVTSVPLHIAPGWHCFEGYDFYRDKNGKTVTKPTVIDGKLYKFDKNGVCKGSYTGFANTKKGKVYYSKGVLVKNKVLKFRNGTRYKADKNGILTKI